MYIEEYIKVPDLKDGYLYLLIARNMRVGIWNKDKGVFFGRRYKFGDIFIDDEIHYDLDNNYGTAQPIKEIEEVPKDLIKDHKQLIEYLWNKTVELEKEDNKLKDEFSKI